MVSRLGFRPVGGGIGGPDVGLAEDLAGTVAAALDADGDGRIDEEEIVRAFARYFTVPE